MPALRHPVRVMAPGVFVAQFPGWCPRCDDEILVNDLCRYDRGEPVHVQCPVDRVAKVPTTVCPRCNLTRPCEHDDG